ncbi:hypothetical protein [Clostridium hydrogeniformans]|uniref:hypothetical protein n=1 Tax=Clostridium hydrogeniformans TaxID=349933 RepID=UPI0004826C27|nr:hypothetical protein [Clostridium hydrogeniformans]
MGMLLILCILGVIQGNIVYRVSKYIINRDNEKIREFKVNKLYIEIAMVITTIAIFIKFNISGILVYSAIGTLLVLIAIVDYHTMYVYFYTAIIGIIYAFVIAIGSRDLREIKFIIILVVILLVAAKVTGEWYGDVEVIFIIFLTLGVVGGMITMSVTGILGIFVAIKKRTVYIVIPYCPLLVIGYYFTLIFL